MFRGLILIPWAIEKRIKKKVYGTNGVHLETVVFVYSGGKLVAEYSTKAPPQAPKIKYLTEDHLGTPRVITNGNGQVESRRDFLPFGEEIGSSVGTRSGFQYSPNGDDVRQKFTGYQKDEESGLDFAEARMYENRHGRFTAIDPLLASGNSANPQTFNRFVYVGDNPINITDPLGLDWFFSKEANRYKWFGGDPDAGYTAVTMGSTGTFSYAGCIDVRCTVTATHYLYEDGTNAWDSRDYVEKIGVLASLTDFSFQAPNDVANGGGKWLRNKLRSIPNALIETNFIGAPFDSPDGTPMGLSARKLGASLFFDYEEYNTPVEQATGFGLDIQLAAVSSLAGGAGVSRFGNPFASPSVRSSALSDGSSLARRAEITGDFIDNKVLRVHGPNSSIPGKSRFSESFDIRNGIRKTLDSSDSLFYPNTQGRPGTIMIRDFGKTIVGFDRRGNPAFRLKTVLDESGILITAYPFR